MGRTWVSVEKSIFNSMYVIKNIINYNVYSLVIKGFQTNYCPR